MALHRFCVIELFAEVQFAMNRINLTLISKLQKNTAFALQIRHIGIKKQQRPRRSHTPPLNTGYTTMHCSWAAHGHQVISTVSVALQTMSAENQGWWQYFFCRLAYMLLYEEHLEKVIARRRSCLPEETYCACTGKAKFWESQNVVDK